MVDTALEKKIVIDSRRNVWLFYHDASGRIGCTVRRSRGEPAAEQLGLSETVSEYDIIIDERDNIHLAAITSEQRIAYMRHDTKDWAKHILYSFNGKPVFISNLKAISAAGSLHLFYVYSEKGGCSALFHHQWTGNEWKGYRIFDISTVPGKICYDADTGIGKGLRVAAVDRGTLSHWEFDGVKWMQSAKNDSGTWDKTENVLIRQDCILVKTTRGALFVRKAGGLDRLLPEEIIESRHVDQGPVLIERRNALYIAWGKEGSLGYRASYDRGASWGRVKYYHHVHGEKLEVYGFSNNYSLLINARRIIATSPPVIHIPFLHRSMERIEFPQEVFSETLSESRGLDEEYRQQSGGCPYGTGKTAAFNKESDGHKPEMSKQGTSARGEQGTPAMREQSGDNAGATGEGMACRFRQPETDNGLLEKTEAEIKRIWAEIEKLKQGMDADIRKRLDKLEAEVEELKNRPKNAGRRGTPFPTDGSVITQDMINRYMKKK